tara:strand:- start:16 stop:915 length:900 start_codon:yes stop_codon:yes gene_type:complete
MFRLKTQVSKKCNQSIVISGIARSGTSIIGRIIHSLKNVEYSFEPGTLFSLFPLIDILNKKYWMLLYETYLYEDFLMNSLAGRNLNYNNNELSFIYDVKSKKEINSRSSKANSKEELEIISDNHIIAYKMPDILIYFSQLKLYYPEHKFVITTRNPIDVINSLKEKSWFSDESLIGVDEIFPQLVLGEDKAPFWINIENIKKWNNYNELDKCAYYYDYMMQKISLLSNKIFIINYDDLLNRTSDIVDHLCEYLNLEYGDKTDELISSVVKREKPRDLKIINKISDNSLRSKIENYQNLF